MKYKINNHILKRIMILLYSFLCFLVFLINLNPMKQYDFSLYAQIPTLGWVLVFLILFGCLCVMLLTFNYRLKKVYYLLSLTLISLLNIIIINIPNILGYKYNSGSDFLTHVGYSVDILKTGFTHTDIYPSIHILIANLNIISLTNLDNVVNLLGSCFYILFLLSSYLLAKEILSKKIAIFAAFASSVLFFYYYYSLFPMGYAFMLFPLIFYLYFKYSEEKSPETAILLIFLSMSLVFFHPVAAFFLAISLLICEMGKIIYYKYYMKNDEGLLNPVKYYKILLTIPLLVLITFMLWFWENTKFWIKFINGIIDLFRVELTTTPITATASEGFSVLGLSHFEIILFFLKIYGHVLIYSTLFIMILYLIFSKKPLGKINSPSNLFKLSILLIILSGLAVVDFIQPLTDLSSGRLIYPVITFLPIFAGLALYRVSNPLKKGKISKKVVSVIVLFILLTSSIIGIISLFPSPTIYRVNGAITSEHYEGIMWLNDYSNKKIDGIRLLAEPAFRVSDVDHGTLYENQLDQDTPFKIQDHFNYNNITYFGQNFKKDIYFTNRGELTILMYERVYPQIKRFTKEDFLRFNQDISTNKIYENGEIENWYIKAYPSNITI